MFDNAIPQILTQADLDAMTPRQRSVRSVTTPERAAEIMGRREREASRVARAQRYVDAGGNAWANDDASIARVYFNGEFGHAEGYYDVDADRLVSKRGGVSDDEFAAQINAKIGG